MTAKRIRERVMALFAVAVMFMTCLTATPAFAANTPVKGGTVTFDKYLVMDENANVPPVTFTYTIEAGTAVSGSEGQPAIYAGDDGDRVEGFNGLSGIVSFSSTDSKQTGNPASSGQQFVEKTVSIDFTNVTYNAPGIYRYKVTEASSHPQVTTDGPLTLDVLVTSEDDGRLTVNSYNVYKGDGTSKVTYSLSTLSTSDLTLTKDVTGNQGDRDKYFDFTVVISGAVEGTKYSIAGPTTGENPNNPNEMTVNADGTATGTFHLKHGQSIVIQGLTEGTTYSITEDSYASDGYETSYKIDNNEVQEQSGTGDQTMSAADHTVTFTNHKEGTVPTGILLETGPYMIMGAVVVVGLGALVATRRRQAR